MRPKMYVWDEANINKNWEKHRVSPKECEEVFSNTPLLSFKDIKHSIVEERLGVLGKTNRNRLLHIIFTFRNQKIRVISVRDMNKKERSRYEKETG